MGLKNDSNDEDPTRPIQPVIENVETLEALKRLAISIESLDDGNKKKKNKKNSDDGEEEEDHCCNYYVMSHWREIPPDVNEALDMIDKGTELIQATSTKYTLMGKASPTDFGGLAEELRKGAEVIATGALVIHTPTIGCGIAFRTHVKRRIRNIIASLIQLVETFVDGTAYGVDENIAARKTGAVWDNCVTSMKGGGGSIPRGNRTAVRRDYFQWIKDCNETMEEFQEIVNLGPTTVINEEEEDGTTTGDDDTWDDDFGGGEEEQYTSLELDVVGPSLALIRCSRGTLALCLSACEVAGETIVVVGNSAMEDEQTTAAAAAVDESSSSYRHDVLDWMGRLYDCAKVVGEGVTDLGTMLYPPLELTMGSKTTTMTTTTSSDSAAAASATGGVRHGHDDVEGGGEGTTTQTQTSNGEGSLVVVDNDEDAATRNPLAVQLKIQETAILALHDLISEISSPPVEEEDDDDNDNDNDDGRRRHRPTGGTTTRLVFPPELMEKAAKLRTAIGTRYDEAVGAIRIAQQSSSS